MSTKLDPKKALRKVTALLSRSLDPRYTEAVAALRVLVEANDSNSLVHGADNELVSETRESRYAATEHLEREPADHVCVHRMTDKACPQDRTHMRPIPGGADLSEWVCTVDGSRRIVSQPYGLEYITLKALVAYCERNGFEASIDAHRSWYSPGRTLLVELRRKRKP